MERIDVAAALVFLALAACTGSTPKVVEEGEMAQVYQREWDLQSIVLDGKHDVMHVDAKMTLNFAPGGQIAGFGAVNRFAGTYKMTPDGKVAWGSLGIIGERKKGPPELIDKERNYLEALQKTNMLIVGRHGLVLQRDDGSTVLSFREAGY